MLEVVEAEGVDGINGIDRVARDEGGGHAEDERHISHPRYKIVS